MDKNCGLIYRVDEGENLYQIARKYHVGIDELIYCNPYINVYCLKCGDEIYIPVCIQENPHNCEQTVKDVAVR